jgi:hypothetical protein
VVVWGRRYVRHKGEALNSGLRKTGTQEGWGAGGATGYPLSPRVQKALSAADPGDAIVIRGVHRERARPSVQLRYLLKGFA